MRNAIAVDENQVLASALPDRLVEDLCLPESTILMPDVLQGKRRRNHYSRDLLYDRRSRSVIGNDNLEILERLALKRSKHKPEVVDFIIE